MVDSATLWIGVMGAGHWAQVAHLPSYEKYSDKARVVAICDTNEQLAEEVADRFKISEVYGDFHDLLENSDIDVVDVCSSAPSHFPIALDAIKRRKSILCEKPLAMNHTQARLLAETAKAAKVKTKMGFTFRYSPALRKAKELIEGGFIGEPYLFNGFEQNSQFIKPDTPFRWSPSEDVVKIMPGSLEEYAPHLIDIALWLLGDVKQVSGNMRNFIPERYIRDRGKMMPINIEDATVCLVDFANGAQGTLQSSFVAVGGYPGVEIRVFGSKGAVVVRLVEESGRNETIKVATPEQTEFREVEIPAASNDYSREKKQSWVNEYFGSLVRAFVTEITEDRESEADFSAGARVQEVEDAIYASHLERRWFRIPAP